MRAGTDTTPSATYGVNRRELGGPSIDQNGHNA